MTEGRAGGFVAEKVPESPEGYGNFVLTLGFTNGDERQDVAFYMLRCFACASLVAPEDYDAHNDWHLTLKLRTRRRWSR